MKAPMQVLQDQAKQIEHSTHAAVKGEVTAGHIKPAADTSLYTFYLVAPQINYRYELFTVVKNGASYPVTIHLDNGKPVEVQASSENEFNNQLSNILQSAKTKKLIREIAQQSSTVSAPTTEPER